MLTAVFQVLKSTLNHKTDFEVIFICTENSPNDSNWLLKTKSFDPPIF